MSKIFVHVKKKQKYRTENYQEILKKLNPIPGGRNKLVESNSIIFGISAYNPAILFDDKALALGRFKDIPEEAYRFGNPAPDGVAAFIRYDQNNNLEILTNKTASRTIWYYFDDKEFIASTSQRAIINILGNYQHNDLATSWLISSGNLGPGISWDKRIKHLDYSSSIFLNFQEWSSKLRRNEDFGLNNHGSGSEKKLRDILTKSFEDIQLSETKNVLTLSGGYDSRYVSEMLRMNGVEFDVMTWGIPASLKEKDTDGYIAKAIAEKKGYKFHFYNVAWKEQTNFEEFVKNFVSAGEARIDHLANYMDNFAMWKDVAEKGFDVVIRSDEVFGWIPVADEKNVRMLMEMSYLGDFNNFENTDFYGMEKIKIPEQYLRRDEESLSTWRDRLFNIYRQTFVQAALHDLYYPFVEMVNPLFSNEIVDYVRTFNDNERTNKKLYVKAIDDYVNFLPVASRSSYPTRENVLRSKGAVSYFRNTLSNSDAKKYISEELLTKVLSNLSEEEGKVKRNSSSVVAFLSDNLPPFIKNYIRRNFRSFNLDHNLVAFRIALVISWAKIIEDDLLEIKRTD